MYNHYRPALALPPTSHQEGRTVPGSCNLVLKHAPPAGLASKAAASWVTRRDKLSHRGPAFPATDPSVLFRLRH
jgi:hypothetical protein